MKDGIHVFWLRDEHRHPVSCVASKIENGAVKFAVATHNPHDKFNKKTGRNKAIGRLQAALQINPKNGELHHKTIPISEGEDPRILVLRAIQEEPRFGISAVKAAQGQLETDNIQ